MWAVSSDSDLYSLHYDSQDQILFGYCTFELILYWTDAMINQVPRYIVHCSVSAIQVVLACLDLINAK